MGLRGKMRYLIFLILSTTLFSQNTSYGGGPNMFYNNMYTAREVAMGGVGISSADGYLASIWNPACIVPALEGKKWLFGINGPPEFIQRFSNTSFSKDDANKASKDWISSGFLTQKFFYDSTKVIYLGGSVIHEDYGKLTETTINTNNEIEPVGAFNLSQSLLLFSIAGKFDDFSIGISGKYMHSDHIYGNSFSNRWGLDAGLVQSFDKEIPFFDKIKWGFVLKLDRDKYNQKTVFGLGPSFIKHWSSILRHIFSLDVITGEFMVPEIRFGTDLGFFKRSQKYIIDYEGDLSVFEKKYQSVYMTDIEKINQNITLYRFRPEVKGKPYPEKEIAWNELMKESKKKDLIDQPICNLYAGISANFFNKKLGIKSFNFGGGINFPSGWEVDIVYSKQNKIYTGK